MTPNRLSELLKFDPETGRLKWLVDRTTGRGRVSIRCGDVAGKVRPNGYLEVSIDGRRYGAHRIAWTLAFGRWPDQEIDHMNGDKADNRLSNLRDVSRQVNAQNMRIAQRHNKSSGLLGAHWCKSNNAWQAKLKLNGKTVHIGFYDTKDGAHGAYLAEKRRLHAGCTI